MGVNGLQLAAGAVTVVLITGATIVFCIRRGWRDAGRLTQAAIAGDLKQVRAILARGRRDPVGLSRCALAMGIAAGEGRHDIVRAILEAGVPVDARHADGSTTLRCALTFASLWPVSTAATVRLLLDAGADPDIRGWDGQTPHVWAMWWRGRLNDHPKTLDRLYDKRPDEVPEHIRRDFDLYPLDEMKRSMREIIDLLLPPPPPSAPTTERTAA